MFEAVNEIAVLGTTFFMMAVATVWYSPMMFGAVWMKAIGISDDDVEKAKPHMWKQMVVTFVSYALMLLLLAHVVAFSGLVGLVPFKASILVMLFVSALAIGPVVWEGRSLSYYFVNTGFYAVFILFGTLILEYWPW